MTIVLYDKLNPEQKTSMSSLNDIFSYCHLEVQRSIPHKSSNHFSQELQCISLVLAQTYGTSEGSSDFFQ